MSLEFKRQLFGEKWFISGLSSYMKFNNNLLDNIQNTATTYNGTTVYVDSSKGKSLSNNMVTGYCKISLNSGIYSLSDGTNDIPFTFYIRLKPTAYGQTGNRRFIWLKWQNGSSTPLPSYCFDIDSSGRVRFYRFSLSNINNHKLTRTIDSIPLNEFTNLILTSNGIDDIKIYFNKIQMVTEDILVGSYIRMQNNDNAGLLQTQYTSQVQTASIFLGEVDELAFWKHRIFNQQQVEQINNREVDLL